MTDAPMDAIKQIAMIDFGQYRVKKGINRQDNDTRESIVEATPNTEYDAKNIEIAIDTWLNLEDKVIISTNVTNY
jgi:hypothetical protein